VTFSFFPSKYDDSLIFFANKPFVQFTLNLFLLPNCEKLPQKKNCSQDVFPFSNMEPLKWISNIGKIFLKGHVWFFCHWETKFKGPYNLMHLIYPNTFATLTFNYIIFRNVEFLKKIPKNKLWRKILNLQEYFICQNENLKLN